MIEFVIVSGGLSLFGFICYILIRYFLPGIHARRAFLWGIVLFSLAMGFYSREEIAVFEKLLHRQSVSFTPLSFGEIQYKCECVHPNYGHRIYYQSTHWLQWIVAKSDIWAFTSIILFTLLLIKLFFQINHFRLLFKRSEKSSLLLRGRQYLLINPPNSPGPAAGWWGKSFLIWDDSLAGLNKEEQEAVFSHELTHIKLGHPIERYLLAGIQLFWFWNPVFYLLRKEFIWLGECIADDEAAKELTSPKQYAQLLLDLQKQHLGYYLSRFGSNFIKKRIRRQLMPVKGPGLPVQIKYSALPIFLGLYLLLAFQLLPSLAKQSVIIKFHQQYEVELSESAGLWYCTDCDQVCDPCEFPEVDRLN